MMIRSVSFFLILVLSLLEWGCKPKVKRASFPLQNGETVSVKVIQVQNQKASENITVTGLLSTDTESKLAFKIGGVVDKVLVSEGQYFKKGQVLAYLKTAEIDAQLEQAQLALEKNKRDLARVKNLYADSVATLEEMQNSQTAFDVAQRTVDQLGFNKTFASIVSVAEGFVTKKITSDGEVVSPGSPILSVDITGDTGWLLKAGVSDKQWSYIDQGQKAVVEFDAFPGKKFHGSVFRKSRAAESQSGLFQIEIKVELEGKSPAVGMFARASILATHTSDLPIVPHEALIEADGDNAFVFSPTGQGGVSKIPVLIDHFDGNGVIIKSGLENVREIVVSNSPFLNENSTISISK